MPVLRTRSLVAFLVALAPVALFTVAASAAPTSKTSRKQGSTASHGTARPAAKSGLKNASHHPTAHAARPAAPKRKEPSKSVGSPTDGYLVSGAHLSDAPYLRGYPVYAGSDRRWGTDVLVGLVDRAARSVRKQFPDAVLSMGQLSKNGGGDVDRHASHESGRDADCGFYVKNSAGKPIYADHMVAFTADGTAPTWPGARFDDARNWAFVAAIVGDGHARVTHMFVATPIRQRLLSYAAKIGASPAIRQRASEVLAQPRGSLPHDDHFHVRIACPSGSDKCIEQPVARARRGHHAPVASRGHAAHPSASASARPAAAAPSSRAPSKPAARAEPHEESARSEASIPSLSPSIPGLDSAVIPAPLTGVRPTWGTEKEAPAPPAEPIDDPDGVLEGN